MLLCFFVVLWFHLCYSEVVLSFSRSRYCTWDRKWFTLPNRWVLMTAVGIDFVVRCTSVSLQFKNQERMSKASQAVKLVVIQLGKRSEEPSVCLPSLETNTGPSLCFCQYFSYHPLICLHRSKRRNIFHG